MALPPLFEAIFADRRLLAAVVGPIIVYILFAFFMPTSRAVARSGPATVILTGPPDAGKTALFAKLVYGTYPQTHTSIESSDTTVSLKSLNTDLATQVRLVDLPGHPRLKDELKKYIPSATAVVFVVDIVSLVRNSGAVAEQLHPILAAVINQSARAPMSAPTPRLLLLAHKTDLLIRPTPPSHPSPPDIPAQTRTVATERLRSILTREMDRLKSARANSSGGRIEGMGKVATSGGGWFSRLFGGNGNAAVAATEGEGEGEEDDSLMWGAKGPFKWEEIDGVEITWGCSGLGMVDVGTTAGSQKDVEGDVVEGDGLSEVRSFLLDL